VAIKETVMTSWARTNWGASSEENWISGAIVTGLSEWDGTRVVEHIVEDDDQGPTKEWGPYRWYCQPSLEHIAKVTEGRILTCCSCLSDDNFYSLFPKKKMAI